MDEYISREEAKRFFNLNFGGVSHAIIASRLLDEIPAADVAPVLHGRWIEQEKYTFGTMYDCSICANRILDNGHSWNYCPNCGAKMDLEAPV